MSTQLFKGTVTAASFPFSYHHASRSVLLPNLDIAPRTNTNFVGTPDSLDYNFIQLLLAENVIPIAKGLQSVTFRQQIAPLTPAASDFDQLILINNADGTVAEFCPARGKNYVLIAGSTSWASYDAFTWADANTLVSKAYLNGRTLIFYERTKCIELDPSGPTFNTLTLNLPSGYAIADIRGNCAASNYHILFTRTTILWSTLADVLEFDDPDQGSGFQIPLDLKGQITCCVPIPGGFLICSTQNMVAASFTNDASRPFVFREVLSSAGISGPEQITDDANSTGHFAYGEGGLQQVTLQRADGVFPEATDFLSGTEVESWDPVTKTVITTLRAQNLTSKLRFLGSRYLAISYGAHTDYFDFILLHDLVLQRWGKLRVRHVDCDTFPIGAFGTSIPYYALVGSYADQGTLRYEDYYTGETALQLRSDFAVLQSDGTVLIMQVTDRTGSTANPPSIVLFGHIQIKRDRYVTIQSVELDGIAPTTAPEVTLLGSLTGYARTGKQTAVKAQEENAWAEFRSRFTAKNVDVAIEGAFELTNLIVGTTVHGTR